VNNAIAANPGRRIVFVCFATRARELTRFAALAFSPGPALLPDPKRRSLSDLQASE
jgi:hypothetical protein